jgi:large subunit ribosomal protein L25
MKIEISASPRTLQGTSASRRLRHAGKVPGIVYGGEKDAVSIELDHKDMFYKLKNEAFHASVLTLDIGGKKEQVLLRDYQMHSFKPLVMHIDFQRVSQTEKIHMRVPLHFVNAELSPGVKLAHGIANHVMTEADVSCLAKDLPEFIQVDLGHLQAGHSVHLSEIKLPKGVEFVDLHHGDDRAVATIVVPRGAKEAAAEETPAA